MESNAKPRYNTHFSGYGLGWFLNDSKGNLQVSHSGGLSSKPKMKGISPNIHFSFDFQDLDLQRVK